jgi:FAD/FMN-containing dehydrogenase
MNDSQAPALTNWSGDIRFTPLKVENPPDEQALVRLINYGRQKKLTIRALGAGHSCAPLIETGQLVIKTDHFKGLHNIDTDKCLVTLGAGMTIEEIGECLFTVGFGMENTGHINKQVLAGAISTGTHGAGKKLTNLSGQVYGAKIVTGTGEVKTYTQEGNPEMMQALRVSLGSFGIFTELTLKVLPRFKLHRQQYFAPTENCVHHLDELMENNRNFCFYWYPRRDDVSIRIWNEPGQRTQELPFAKLYKELSGWGKDVLPSEQHLKFNELEYSFDLSAAPVVFEHIRKRIKEKHRHHVAWRVLYRPVAGDDSWLSNAYGKNVVAITIHHHASLPYREYFDDIEDIFIAFGGRPHWGKKHRLGPDRLRHLYPMWEQFHELRRQFDPDGIFLNDYLKKLFIDDERRS